MSAAESRSSSPQPTVSRRSLPPANPLPAVWPRSLLPGSVETSSLAAQTTSDFGQKIDSVPCRSHSSLAVVLSLKVVPTRQRILLFPFCRRFAAKILWFSRPSPFAGYLPLLCEPAFNVQNVFTTHTLYASPKLSIRVGSAFSTSFWWSLDPARACEVDVVYVGITSHLPTRFLKNVCAYCLYARACALTVCMRAYERLVQITPVIWHHEL